MIDYTDQSLFTRIPADLSGQKDRKGTYARRAQPELPPLTGSQTLDPQDPQDEQDTEDDACA